MPRRKIYIDDSVKEVICTLHDQKKSSEEILKHLIDRYGVKISLNVLQTRLKAWGKSRYKVLPSKNEIYMQNLKTAIRTP